MKVKTRQLGLYIGTVPSNNGLIGIASMLSTSTRTYPNISVHCMQHLRLSLLRFRWSYSLEFTD